MSTAAATNTTLPEADVVGYIKYDGRLVDEGMLDAKSAAKALHGFDHALRYFVTQQRPELATVEYPIPVRLERGSWWAIIPQSVEVWIQTALGIAATAYLTKAASKMAERDFQNVGFRDVFRAALRSVQWIIKIGKHVGTLAQKVRAGLRWRNENREVGIPNEHGELLYVPREVFELYLECPSSILSEMASVVEFERQLTVGLDEAGLIEEVTITRRERAIFYADEEETGEVLFPELAHGQDVRLEGIVTRGNERTNSIGFLYNEHVLTCYPRHGSIVRFKPHMFLRCRIAGQITRENTDTGEPDEPRPKIIFDDLVLLEDAGQGQLFPPVPE